MNIQETIADIKKAKELLRKARHDLMTGPIEADGTAEFFEQMELTRTALRHAVTHTHQAIQELER